MYDYDRTYRSTSKQAGLNEATAYMIKDASFGPGAGPKAVASAKPATMPLTATQEKVLQRFDGETFGFVSKALIYDKPAPKNSVELRALASLMKGGLLVAVEKSGGIPGAPPSRVGAQGPRHYVLQRSEPVKLAATANKKFDRYVALAADDIEKLRKSDVFRVLSEAKSAKELTALSAYLSEKRQDLEATIKEDAKDVTEEKGW